MDRRPSINDVASHAGVSSKTVSNVLHGRIRVAEPTRTRVLDAIAELGYRPDLHARYLRSGRSGILAVAMPNLDLPFFAELTSELVSAARDRGYTVLVDETGGSADHEADLLGGIAPRFADGVIISPQGIAPDQLAGLLAGTPTVLLGDHVAGLAVDHVVIDNVTAAEEATRHLIDLGRTRIAAIGQAPGYDDAQEHADFRIQGYRKALTAARLPYDPALVVPGSARRPEDGAEAVRRLLPSKPDALFCITDLLALGALQALHQAGLRVPEDVAVVGFDDIAQGRYSIPTLTTIAPDKQELATQAVGLLTNRLTNPDVQPQTVTVPHRLVIRESAWLT